MTLRLTSVLVALALTTAMAAAYTELRPAAAPTSTSAATAVSSLIAGDAVPMPAKRSVLTLSGALDNTNAGRSLLLDVRTLDRMGLTPIAVYDPFRKRRVRFRAIPLRNLFDVAMARSGATTVHAVALDDYSVDIPLDVALDDGAYLATRNGDGSPIALAAGGPIRVVFLGGSKYEHKVGYWIWSLDAMRIR